MKRNSIMILSLLLCLCFGLAACSGAAPGNQVASAADDSALNSNEPFATETPSLTSNEAPTVPTLLMGTITNDRMVYELYDDNGVGYAVAVARKPSLSGDYVIPDTLTDNGNTYPVIAIDPWVFFNLAGLTSVTIGDNIQTISASAFMNCTGLTSITIPDSVQLIGDGAFAGCTSLTSVDIGSGVQIIGSGAFDGCSDLSSVTIGDKVQAIGNFAFHGCASLTGVVIPDNVQTIGNWSFWGCSSMANINFGASVQNIGFGAFSGCPGVAEIAVNSTNPHFLVEDGVLYSQNKDTVFLTDRTKSGNLVLDDSVTIIQVDSIAYSTSLTGVTLPDGLLIIDDGAFSKCENLSMVTIGDNVQYIGEYAFFSNSLTGVDIPGNVQTIGEGAFMYCAELSQVTFWGDVPPAISNMFGRMNYPGSLKITVPAGTLETYKVALAVALESAGLSDDIIVEAGA